MKKTVFYLFFVILLMTLLVPAFAQTYLSESFEGTWSGTPAAPAGWTQVQAVAGTGSGGSDIAWEKSVYTTSWSPAGNGTKPTAAQDGSAVAHYNDYNAQLGQKDRLITGTLDLSAAANPRLTFYYAYYSGSAVLKVYASTDNGTNWTQIGATAGYNAVSAAYTKVSFSIPATYKVATAKFAIEITAAWGSHDIWLDSFKIDEAPAPLVGTKTIKASGGDFSSLTSAIAMLNDAGISGPVTFVLDDDATYTEAAPMNITATGTATNTITFQRSGTGTNKPIINIAGTSATTEAGIKVSGGDYITFNGLTIADAGSAAASYIEYGISFVGAATNGCRYNTVKNCTIDLSKANTSSKGILMSSVATAASGINSYNKFYNNTITDAYNAYTLAGMSATYMDDNNEIGTIDGGTSTISNIGGGSSAVYLINYSYNSNLSIHHTTMAAATGNTGAVYGIYASGGNSNTVAIYSNQINTLSSTTGATAGIFIYYGANTTIHDNTVYGISATSGTAWGINLTNSTTTTNLIYNNMIYNISAPASTTAPGVRGLGVAGGSTNKIYFNTVFLDYTSTVASNQSAALYMTSSATGIDLRNNIFVNKSVMTTGTRAVALYTSAASVLSTSMTMASNCNLYYCGTPAANALIYYDGTNSDQTLAALKTRASNKEQNSVTEDVPFISAVSPYNLHISTSVATQVESGGQTVAEVTKDIDGQTRLNPPDLGVDEGNFIMRDLTGPSIAYTALGNTAATSNRRLLNVAITDPSGISSREGEMPKIYFKKKTDANTLGVTNSSIGNGWKWTETTDSDSPYSFTIDYSLLRSAVAIGDTIQYFIVAGDGSDPANLSANPASGFNAGGSTSTELLAAAVAPTTPNSYVVKPGYAGTITVGTGGTYPDLTSATGFFNAINNGIVTSNITVNIISDIAETGVTALNTTTEDGTGNYTITVQPNSIEMRTLTGTGISTNPMIKINGASRIIFNGTANKNLTLACTNTTATSTTPNITFMNGSTACTVTNCNIISNQASTSNGLIRVDSGTNDVTISNNIIHDNATNPSTGIYSVTGTNKLTITGNNIYNFTSYGIYVTGAAENSTIANNNIYYSSATASAVAQFGIYYSNSSVANISISNNKIGGSATACGGTPWINSGTSGFTGIYVSAGTVTPATVQNNTITNINLSATGACAFMGIYTNSGLIISTSNIVGDPIYTLITIAGTGSFVGIKSNSSVACPTYNNIIAGVSFTSSTGSATAQGIYHNNGDVKANLIRNISATQSAFTLTLTGIHDNGASSVTYEISNNMIALDAGASAEAVIKGLCDNTYSSATIGIYYNSINIYGTASTVVSAAYYRSVASISTIKNNIFSNQKVLNTSGKTYAVYYGTQGVTPANVNNNDLYATGPLAYWAADVADLASFQTASGCDMNSKSANPNFTANNNLHCMSGDLDGAATPISGITTDFDGATRNATTPDIGADEFELTMDQTSVVENPTSQVFASAIPALNTTIGQAVDVISFKIHDLANTDPLSTNVSNVRIKNANPANTATWTNTIAGAILHEGPTTITTGTVTVTNNYIDIAIPAGNLVVNSGSSKELTVGVYLKTSAIDESKVLQFKISSPAHGFGASASGSLFAPAFADSVYSGVFPLSVEATKLAIAVPYTCVKAMNFPTTVKAVDANGNTDINNSATVTLSVGMGTGALSSVTGIVQTLTNGVFNWTDLQYNAMELFTIGANCTTLTGVVSDTISCNNYAIVAADNAWTGTHLPIDPYYGYSYSQSIFKPTEVFPGTITKIAYYFNGNSAFTDAVKVYMGTTSLNAFTATSDFVPSTSMTKVYDGNLTTTTTAGWINLPLSSPFTYNGSQNLVITIAENTSGWHDTNDDFYAANLDGTNRSICFYQDDAAIDPTSPSADYSGVSIYAPFLKVFYPTEMIVGDITATQASTANVYATQLNQQILCMTVNTVGNLSPLSVSTINLNTTGTTNVADIANAKIYYTGTNSTFATTNLFGQTSSIGTKAPVSSSTNVMRKNAFSTATNNTRANNVSKITSTERSAFAINGTQELANGTNYFWLVYDIATTPTVGDKVDGELVSMVIGGATQTPTAGNPTGNRTIAGKKLAATPIVVAQGSTADVSIGTNNANILQVKFVVEETTTLGEGFLTMPLNSIKFSSLNQNNNDITTARLFNTLTSTIFATTTQLGTDTPIAVDGSINFATLNYDLPVGSTYLWLAYNVSNTATSNDTIDAQIEANAININGTLYPAVAMNPTGKRTIKNFNYGGGDATSTYGGYYFANSLALTAPDHPTYGWIDPVSNGHTAVASFEGSYGTSTDDGNFTIADIGFDFPFYGVNSRKITININGLLYVGDYTDAVTNPYSDMTTIPTTSLAYSTIAVALADLELDAFNSITPQVYYKAYPDKFVVTYMNVHEYTYGTPTQWLCAQVTLRNNGNIIIDYNNTDSHLVDLLNSIIVGIQNADGTKGISYLANGVGGTVISPSKSTGMAVAFGFNPTTLPVELTAFTATSMDGNKVSVNWTTQTESQILGYNVLRSTDNNVNHAIQLNSDRINAHNTSETHYYALTDTNVEVGATYYYWIQIADFNNATESRGPVSVTVDNGGSDIPTVTVLRDAYPNPFNPTTTISYSVKQDGNVNISIYNIKGQLVKTLVNNRKVVGNYKAVWNGCDNKGKKATSGIYFYRMTTTGYCKTSKMIMLK